jgi:Anti-sigma-K factor rskA
MTMGAMDHTEMRELLQDAAVEPGGIERLMAGDTPAAALVAGHLAGCPDCAAELERLRRSVGVIRPVVRAVPPADLRGRTLDYVAAMGRPRGAATQADVAAPAPIVTPTLATRRARRLPLRTLAALAAVFVVAVAGTGVLIGATVVQDQAAEVEALGEVARWTMRVDGQPDARRVILASSTGAGTTGTLLFSPSSRELVVVADELAKPPAGHEYRCWVEVGGVRKPIGKMFFGGDLAYWVGPSEAVSSLPADTRFGVSLIDLASPGLQGDPVLSGVG